MDIVSRYTAQAMKIHIFWGNVQSSNHDKNKVSSLLISVHQPNWNILVYSDSTFKKDSKRIYF